MAGGIHPPPDVVKAWPRNGIVEIHGLEAIVTSVALFALALAILAVRLFTRLKVRKTLLVADWLVISSMVPLTGLNVSVVLGVMLYGFDRHVWDLTPALLVASRKTVLAVDVTYILATGLLKLSILCFYLNLTAGTEPKIFRALIRTTMATIVAYIVGSLVVIFLTCRPLPAFWNSVLPEWYASHPYGVEWYAIDEGKAILAITLISVIQDFVVCLLPVQLIWSLQMPLRKRVAAVALCGAGIIVCVVGIVRAIVTQTIYYQTYDVTWHAYYAFIFTLVEANLAVCCASMPSLKFFFDKIFNMTVCPVVALITRVLRTRWQSPDFDRMATAILNQAKRVRSIPRLKHTVGSDYAQEQDIEMGSISPIKVRVRHEVEVRSEAASPRHSMMAALGTMTVGEEEALPVTIGQYRLSSAPDMATFSCDIVAVSPTKDHRRQYSLPTLDAVASLSCIATKPGKKERLRIVRGDSLGGSAL